MPGVERAALASAFALAAARGPPGILVRTRSGGGGESDTAVLDPKEAVLEG